MARMANLIVSCPHSNPLIWNSSTSIVKTRVATACFSLGCLPEIVGALSTPSSPSWTFFFQACFFGDGHLSVIWSTANQPGPKSSWWGGLERPADTQTQRLSFAVLRPTHWTQLWSSWHEKYLWIQSFNSELSNEWPLFKTVCVCLLGMWGGK